MGKGEDQSKLGWVLGFFGAFKSSLKLRNMKLAMTAKRSPTVSQVPTCTLHVETWIESLVFRWRLRRTTVIVRCHHGWIPLAAWVMAFRALKRGSSRTPWTCTLVTCVLHVISPCSSVMISSFTLPNRVVGHYRHDLKEKKYFVIIFRFVWVFTNARYDTIQTN